MTDILVLKDIHRFYQQGDLNPLEILVGVNCTIKAGELVALVGPSGAGKSTLLHTAGLLEHPQAGDVIIQGESCGKLNDYDRAMVRRRKLGFVYQFHYLLPEFTALENVVIPQLLLGTSKKKAVKKAHELLAQVGLTSREKHRPNKLSGGEQQRVAIARALANGPCLLLADEPTGNLDVETADSVFDMLTGLVRKNQMAVLMATHNLDLAKKMDRMIRIEQKKLTEVELS